MSFFKNKDCILFIAKAQALSKRPGSLHSVCQIESLVASWEHSYNEVHLLACEWRSTLITGQRGELRHLPADMDKLVVVYIFH